MTTVDSAILGCLIGTALGDALGLPFEGLSQQRVARYLVKGAKHRLVAGRGMFSDDTEQTLLLAASIGRFPDDIPAMQRDFAHKLKWWLAALPAGQKSGVYSAASGGLTDA